MALVWAIISVNYFPVISSLQQKQFTAEFKCIVFYFIKVIQYFASTDSIFCVEAAVNNIESLFVMLGLKKRSVLMFALSIRGNQFLYSSLYGKNDFDFLLKKF